MEWVKKRLDWGGQNVCRRNCRLKRRVCWGEIGLGKEEGGVKLMNSLNQTESDRGIYIGSTYPVGQKPSKINGRNYREKVKKKVKKKGQEKTLPKPGFTSTRKTKIWAPSRDKLLLVRDRDKLGEGGRPGTTATFFVA